MIDFQKLHAQFELANPGFDFSKSQYGNYISKGTQESFIAWDRNNLVRKLRTRIKELEEKLEAAQKDTAWIPVSERLPAEGESVFVFSKYGQSDMADFIGGAFENCWLIDDADETITHWVGKPLNPPIDAPKQEQMS